MACPLRCTHILHPPGLLPQEGLAVRAERYGRNAVRPPREVTFWQLVAEALQASSAYARVCSASTAGASRLLHFER